MKTITIIRRRWLGSVLAGALLTLLCGITTAVNAAQPKIGEVAPEFTLKTLEDKSVSLGSLVEKTPIVMLVLRGWPGYQCPLCTQQVHRFVEQAAEFRRHGATVVMVYPGPADQLRAHAGEFLADKSWPADFVFLIDPDDTLTNAYGLRWDAEHETAYPSTFVIDRHGKVVFAKISQSHADRSTPAEVLATLP